LLPFDCQDNRALLNILVFTFDFAQCLVIFFRSMQSRKFVIAIKFFKDSNNKRIVLVFEIKLVLNNLLSLNVSSQTQQDINQLYAFIVFIFLRSLMLSDYLR